MMFGTQQGLATAVQRSPGAYLEYPALCGVLSETVTRHRPWCMRQNEIIALSCPPARSHAWDNLGSKNAAVPLLNTCRRTSTLPAVASYRSDRLHGHVCELPMRVREWVDKKETQSSPSPTWSATLKTVAEIRQRKLLESSHRRVATLAKTFKLCLVRRNRFFPEWSRN